MAPPPPQPEALPGAAASHGGVAVGCFKQTWWPLRSMPTATKESQPTTCPSQPRRRSTASCNEKQHRRDRTTVKTDSRQIYIYIGTKPPCILGFKLAQCTRLLQLMSQMRRKETAALWTKVSVHRAPHPQETRRKPITHRSNRTSGKQTKITKTAETDGS